MVKRLAVGVVAYMAMLATAPAAYEGWQHSGSLYIVTTPEGANLPAAAAEENFPLLVRLNKDSFDFSQAKARGDDIRFSVEGKPLAYQIEEWDAVAGSASIWVRVPSIKGNARQEIKVYWGKADTVSESRGPSVFNSANGYCCVMHLNGDVLDATGSISPVNNGATPTTAVIGRAAWNLASGRSINATNIVNFPTGKNPTSSSEVWIRARQINSWTMPLAWGSKTAYGWNTWIMQVGFWGSPSVLPAPVTCRGPSVVSGSTAIATGQWYHVAFTSSNGTGKLYVNGLLDATASGGALTITNLQALCLGAVGGDLDVDEARISSVARSADWLKMEYENQKALQTLVGSLVQPGSDFSVSEKKITVLEGQRASLSAKAGGAQKVYWVLKKDGLTTTVAVDQLGFSIEAGRVTGDQAHTLQFKAVFADKVKTLEIPVTIREDIPDPVFTLKAPAKWDGRETIEIVPEVSNLKELRQKNVGELKYDWKVSGMAVVKELEPGKMILKRAQNSGMLSVTAAISNGGKRVEQTALIAVAEPKKDAWVQRAPGKDEKAVDNQFFARDDKNVGTLHYNGALSNAADSVFLKLFADDRLIKAETNKIGADKAYAFSVKLKPGLIKYKVEFGSKSGSTETILDTVTNLVCGDAYLIDGQSNALATDTREKSEPVTSAWIRSYGGPTGWGDATDWVRDQFDKVRATTGRSPNLWCNAVWKRQKDEKAELGWWGMELARRLVESQKVPICIIQAAAGGTRIDQHQRCATNHLSLATIYGRMLWRVEQAGLTHGLRGVLWHQGENNQGTASPTGDYDWKSYQDYFLEMSAAWKQDFPNIQHYYIFQIWPNSCSMAGSSGCGDMIREIQRSLPRLYSNMDVMSTLGIKPPGGCHYPLAGWGEFARLMQPLIERDYYGKAPSASVTAPNLKKASYASSTKDAIALEFDQPVVWNDALISEFYLDGAKGQVAAGSVSGNVMTLKLAEPSAAKRMTYLKETNWSQDRLIMGANGIAALTFAEVEIKKYPKLIEVGSRVPNYGGKRGDGWFYSHADIRELVAYAAGRYVTLVPEIEMPGHFGAALTSYPELACGGKNPGGWAAPLCVTRESALEFATDVLDEVVALFPSPYIHVGADEVPAGPWRNCATCKAAMEELGKTPPPLDVQVFRVPVAGGAGVPFNEDIGRLQGEFIRKIDRHLAARGRQMAGWDEILDGGLRSGSSAVVMAWRGVGAVGGSCGQRPEGHDSSGKGTGDEGVSPVCHGLSGRSPAGNRLPGRTRNDPVHFPHCPRRG